MSLVSVWVAQRAPFAIHGHECEPLTNASGISDDLITIDDDTRLNSHQRDLKRLAGRASGHAMTHVLLILVADATLLGALKGNPGLLPAAWWGALLTTLAALKLSVTARTRTAVKVAISEPDPSPVDPNSSRVYRDNARGAWRATLVCLGIDIVSFATGMALLGS